ncbi:metallophosphoesterase family protein [Labrys wisconsinensis]|uniref:Serine/threonine protein phosphatase 1 n=1 Tax=Labrys wisconsinensis TaxID=425677 RepID=A0ABU0JIG2_9HYPH|nr:metallophosphoesterase family protein [Labrys wisconsinensis]MDQ0474067.1 serine/threonine protein phosphatase 1 [Labrys wisconsinensis]
MTETTYAIGDIHGRLDLLEQLLDLVEADAAVRGTAAKVVFTGDYVDRGPDTFGVVERLIAGPRRRGDSFVCLRGNHDDLFVKAVTTGEGLPDWAWTLFRHTIVSYGAGERDWKTSPKLRRHAAHLSALPLTHDDGVHLFVHAGIRPGTPIEDQLEEDLLWIRHEFLDHQPPLPRRVVHGHTIMGDDPVVTPNRVSIDTGAYRSGILTAAVLAGGQVSFLQARGPIDRPAVIREELLSASVHGRAVPPAIRQLYDAFLAGDIDLREMTERSSREFA